MLSTGSLGSFDLKVSRMLGAGPHCNFLLLVIVASPPPQKDAKICDQRHAKEGMQYFLAGGCVNVVDTLIDREQLRRWC